MTRMTWSEPGSRLYEAGVDRGVLYVDDTGVPWTGLIAVQETASGGEAKPKYIDGVKVSNHAAPEQFAASIEAFTYPSAFEQCDGTLTHQNGLRVKRQARKSFNLSYRTKVGNDLEGLDHAYKIHILYNLRVQPSDRGYESTSDEIEPMNFSWGVSSRPEIVAGFRPTAYFEIDSREVPNELLETIENMLYGSLAEDASLPTAGELLFLFDSYDDLVYDAGGPLTPVFSIHDAGSASTPVTSTIDSGGV